MPGNVRAATADDVAAVVALVREGRSHLAEARGGPLWLARHALPEPVEPTIQHTIDDPMWSVQLATIDAAPLGIMIAEVECIADVSVAVIRELFVVPEARGVALGETLMDATISWAKNQGCVGIDGYALPGDRATKNFFETFGLVARGIVVHRAFDTT